MNIRDGTLTATAEHVDFEQRGRCTHQICMSQTADVFVVGDRASVLNPVQDVLRDSGWTVRHSQSADPVVRWLRHNRAAVLVLQTNANPTEVLHAIREAAHRPEVIVLATENVSAEHVLSLGAHDLLRVPVDRYDLLWSMVTAWHAWQKYSHEKNTGGR